MKQNRLIIPLLFIITNFLVADNEKFFDVAETKFKQEQWQEALFEYNKIEAKNSFTWEKIGTCLFHLDQYPQALVAVNRALLAPSFSQFSRLEKLEKNIHEKLHLEQPSEFKFLLKKILFFIPVFLIQIIFLVLLISILLMLIRRFKWQDFTIQEKRFVKKIIILFIFFTGLWFLKKLSFVHDKAIVIKSPTYLYAGPEENFHVIQTLQSGMTVKILNKKEQMYQVTTSKHLGWVKLNLVEPIVTYE